MSPRFLADENIDQDLILGLKRRIDGIDIVRVQDVGLRTRTIPDFAYERVATGLFMPGVLALPPEVPMAVAISDLSVIAGATEHGEWADRVVYLPLR